jgi:hypothetical protein
MTTFFNTKNSNSTLVSVGDGPHRDAFSKLRVSQPYTLFDSVLNHSPQVHNWSGYVLGSGKIEWQSLRCSNYLNVGTDSGAIAYNQTKQNFHYQPGKSLLIMMTFILEPGKDNLRQRAGYFNNEAGMFLQKVGNQMSVGLRTSITGSPEEDIYLQENWSLDALDGDGPSGVTLDSDKLQIFVIDFQWLGAGRVRFGFSFNGQIVYFHEVVHSNIISNVFLSEPDLPCRYEIENIGETSDSSTLEQICCTVISEGGHNPKGFLKGIDTSPDAVTVPDNAMVPLLSLRLKEDNYNSTLIPLNYTIISTTNDDILVRFILNGALSGESWSPVPGIESASEVDTSATTVSGGEIILSEFVNQGSKGGFSLPLQDDSWMFLAATASGVRDVLTIAAQSRSSSASVSVSLNYKEIL